MIFLGELVENNARFKPENEAYVEENRRYNWREIHERTDALAYALQSMGVMRGDRIGILSRDSIEVVETLIACAKIGAIRVGLNFRYAPREIAHLVNDSGLDVLFVQAGAVDAAKLAIDHSERDPKLIGFGPEHNLDTDYETLVAENRKNGEFSQSPHDILMLCYTTGTTGLPKGAIYPHKKMMETIASIAFCMGSQQDDVWLHVMPASGVPIFHMLYSTFHAGKVVIVDEWDAERVLSSIQRERCTNTVMVPTMLNNLLESGLIGNFDCSSMRQISYGAAPMTPSAIQRAMEAFDCRFIQLYGSTELMGMVTMLMPEDHIRAIKDGHECLSSVGKPLYHVQMRIVDDNGEEVPNGEPGELLVKTEFIVPGFWNQNIKYAETIRDGWLRTGDIAVRDDEGYFYMQDRANFRMKSGGYNIFPTEVENCIAEHPAVVNVAVFGIPDPRWGDRIHAVVTLMPGQSVTGEDLRGFCRGKIANFKIPKAIEIWDELPLGATGKILKRSIQETCIDREAQQSQLV